MSRGSSKLITCMQSGTSRPRAATSVATRTAGWPWRKARSAPSRSRCERSPWMEVAGTAERRRNSSSCSAARFVSTKMMVRPWLVASNSTSARRLSFSSVYKTVCVMSAVVDPTRPTATKMYLVMNSDANFWISLGKVAENMSVWRSPVRGMFSRSTTLRICGSKPMSSIRSASSITRCATLASETLPLSIRSTSRPGVATSSVHPLSRLLIWERISAPPYTTTGKTGERCTNFCDSRKICTASSRVGARMRQRGSAARPYC
mmetsp:Transcript_23106/g.53410  ORF Transcript_23106/g.53410 Transcript_23106/m.53410 type:complete len:262 (+) Transcript_23106:516-1301(+)